MSTDEKIKVERDYWLSHQAGLLQDYLDRCQSPIERLFLMSLLNSGWDLGCGAGSYYEWERDVWRIPSIAAARKARSFSPCFHNDDGNGTSKGALQLPIVVDGRSFRLDFAIFVFDTRVAIELDGHEFHEKTKEQARKEKSRQRLLTADGWHVLRFTGSEVYGDAQACVFEAINTAEKLQFSALGSSR